MFWEIGNIWWSEYIHEILILWGELGINFGRKSLEFSFIDYHRGGVIEVG
jgi:hypothetical protein